MLSAKLPRVDRFNGINNVSDPMRLGLEWLATAENVNITDTGSLVVREGYIQAQAGAFSAAYSTADFERMYVVDGGVLKAMAGKTSSYAIKSGLANTPMFWAEVNQQVYFNNGLDSGIVMPDNSVQPWSWPLPVAPTLKAVTGGLPAGLYRACITYVLPDGRETGPSDSVELLLAKGEALQVSGISQVTGFKTRVYIAPADSTVFQLADTPTGTATVWNFSPDYLGADLTTQQLYPVPQGTDVIQAWRGRMYAAQYLPTNGQTVIWFSQPMGYHLFKLDSDYIAVSGKVRMLAPHDSGLVIGTDKAIHLYDGTNLSTLTDYGVVPGQHWVKDGERILFWSTRGLCEALPFTNLTERQVSVAPGIQAGGAIVCDGGQKRSVVALQQGGSAFNSR